MLDSKIYLEVFMATIMLVSLSGILYRTIKKDKGIGARVIQFTCVCFIIPTIIILATRDILKGETVATLIGGLVGYVLSGISNFDKTEPNSQKTKSKPD